jgi:pimeloyl-ACP methyl ester carboxylesterase
VTDATALLPGLEERFVLHRGARLRVFAGGGGPPLLLIHGFGGAAWNFSELAPLLVRRSLVIPDLPGHAGSSALPAAPGLASYADALAACIDAGPVDVLGHSMGGAVALRLAERRPELVRRLVLAAPAGISSSSRGAGLSIAVIGIVKPARIAARRTERIARSRRLKRLVFGPFEVANPDLLTERSVYGLLQGPTMHTDSLGAGRALNADDPRLDLGRLSAPVLLLWGADDRQVPIEDGFEYARRLRAPLRVIADCGHLLIAERPEVCARATLEFLDATRDKPGLR